MEKKHLSQINHTLVLLLITINFLNFLSFECKYGHCLRKCSRRPRLNSNRTLKYYHRQSFKHDVQTDFIRRKTCLICDQTNLRIRSRHLWLGWPQRRCRSGRPESAASGEPCCHRSQSRPSATSLRENRKDDRAE